LCSHGKIYLKVYEKIITDDSKDDDWTTSTAALMLLRSLKEAHIKDSNGFPMI
jgi:hypothetical protein